MYIEQVEFQGGLYKLRLKKNEDNRGSFIKFFHADLFYQFGLQNDYRESFFSKSCRGVIRGMHFQEPLYEQAKLVTIVCGEVIDVVLDLRRGSPTFKKAISFKLNDKEPCALYISPGLAHGFASISENSVLMYMMTKEYSQVHDRGVRWNSIGYEWPFDEPILSERDKGLPCLKDYESPFIV